MTEEKSGRKLSATSKRRCRRKRLAALKSGVVIPYDFVSQPCAQDAPKLTNTSKRNLRLLNIQAAELKARGLVGDYNTALISLANWKKNRLTIKETGGNMSNEKKTKKKKSVETDNNASSDITVDGIGKEKNTEKKSKKRKKDKLGHIRFDESDPEEPVEEDEMKHNSKKIKKSTIDSNRPTVGVESGESSSSDVEVADTNDEPANSKTKHVKKKNKLEEIIDKTKPDKSKQPPKKRRFVLFVGNLSYDTTEEDIRAHFSKAGPIVSVRIAREIDDNIKSKCRGFCHMDLENEEKYLKALSLNHTFMGNRRINVEYSSGQTQELKAKQKKKNYKMKALHKSGRGFEIMNPVGNASKAVKRSKARQVTQKEGNTFWV